DWLESGVSFAACRRYGLLLLERAPKSAGAVPAAGRPSLSGSATWCSGPRPRAAATWVSAAFLAAAGAAGSDAGRASFGPASRAAAASAKSGISLATGAGIRAARQIHSPGNAGAVDARVQGETQAVSTGNCRAGENSAGQEGSVARLPGWHIRLFPGQGPGI